MFTEGTDFQSSQATATTSQYQYSYQYQLPTTTTKTTTTKVTTQPISYTQQFTTSEPVSFTQQYTTSEPVAFTQQYTTSDPLSFVASQPDYGQSFTTTQQTYTTTQSSVPVYGASKVTFVKPQPAFKLLRQGSGISPNEQHGIVSTAMGVYMANIEPLSNNTASRIKKTLGGDWIVIVYPQGKPIDFNMTCVQGNDYMYFTLDNTAYQVCRLR